MTGSAIHTIMLPVREDGMGGNVLAHAAVVARQFGSRVRIIHCHPRPDDLMPYGVVIPKILRKQIEEAARANADTTADQLIAEFKSRAADLGLAEESHAAGKATARFIEYEGKQVDAVRHFGRLADLICVSQPDRESNLGANTLKTALFSSGRPVMMCPHADTVEEGFCRHVAIGWNGSLEASRAAALAMPLIEAADKVTILTTGDTEHSATADEFRRYLELRTVDSEIREFKGRGNVGDKLLGESTASGAGLLIMGAYHESYERETVFGGNSQTVVDRAEMPIVLVH
ncbi:MAG: universal stress protein [Rhodobacteraceae bacterium]|nr:universal stress protein [Paracoccaceae bacterium]